MPHSVYPYKSQGMYIVHILLWV